MSTTADQQVRIEELDGFVADGIAAATQGRRARPLAARCDAVARRTRDVVLSAIGLVVLSPVLLVCAIAIRLDSPGPVLFRQSRIGRGGRPFTILKFRTMRSGASPERHREYVRALISSQPHTARDAGNEQGELYKLTVDDRVTRVGRVLRKWSLDELPQLWNVIRGEMSLVGPRPVIAYEVEQYPASWMARFDVTPGLTGLWQVSGRNERTYAEMVLFDCAYGQRQSFWNDTQILARTVWVVVTRKGAA